MVTPSREVGAIWLQVQEAQGLPANLEELGKGKEGASPVDFTGSMVLLIPWFRLLAPEW